MNLTQILKKNIFVIKSIFYSQNLSIKCFRTIFNSKFDFNHHLIKTLQEYDIDPKINYQKTSLYLYHLKFKPKTLNNSLKIINKEDLPLFVFPWGNVSRNSKVVKDVNKSRFCGPTVEKSISDEFESFISLYKKIKYNGYVVPDSSSNAIFGYILKSKKSKRFVVTQGNHRIAILKHLNHNFVKVNVYSKKYIIKQEDINNFLLVKNKSISTSYANIIFNLFFS